ncbi:unnamed protein product [Zymoseptoria tritici ST99CH_3D7]|uniref:FAD/NAD(P)-binding domain-containing protein n=1 Tax=Zymoseptoria tritici (strain ST99CH_3D7) TaxID=1276538 RepID=A0A1X7RI67_ZYMT9|nr:unnamed protein product [Zymoseptoria tritici ST99CH_3D7]
MAFTPGQDILDTAIIGGGPAGLSTALGLARHLYQVVVFDSERYGNDAASSLHNLVTWDGKAPSEFREAARHNILDTYSTVHWEQTAVEDIVKTAEGNFRLVDAKGKTWSARTVVLATGSEILYPDDVLPGYSDCWASGIFACLFCHGYEDRGKASVGVLAIGKNMGPAPTLMTARMARRLADSVTLYTNGDESTTAQLKQAIGDLSIFKIDPRRIVRLRKAEDGAEVSLEFKSGEETTEGFLAHRPEAKVQSGFVEQLGLLLDQYGNIQVSEMTHATSVAGVFAVGDCSTFLKAVAQAIASGSLCAGGVSGYLSAQLYG